MMLSMNIPTLQTSVLGLLLYMGIITPTIAREQSLGYPAFDNWNIDGQHGVLRVRGALTDSPCRLAMHSADQTINLGVVTLNQFPEIGSEGLEATFQLALTDCLAVANTQMNKLTGLMPWSTDQPGVSVRFYSVDTSNNGRYIKLHGVSGLGLIIKDSTGHALNLGQYSQPRLLPVGQSMLTYTVAPVRTAVAINPGSFYAVINFQLSYD